MTNGAPPAVEARGLVKRYGAVRALDGVDLTIEAGTVLGLLGPNGAGKTTAVHVLATITVPDAGEARVLGTDVLRDPDATRRSIGLAGQFAAVDGILSGRENLRLVGRLTHLPARVADARADELLERFGLADAADRLARTYSGGMRRRLDLAAALVHRPPVVFLDEPTTGLDPASRNDLWETVRELVRGGTTVLLTTQYLEEADQLADRVVVIDRGRVVAEGTPSELKSRIGTTVIDLVMADPGAADAARRVLAGAGLPVAGGEGASVHLGVRDGGRALIHAVRALDARGLEPVTAAVHEPSLDDVFLALTGAHAHPAPEEVAS